MRIIIRYFAPRVCCMKYIFTLISVLFLALPLMAQFNPKPEVKDSAFTIPMIKVSYAHQWKGGDVAERFGNNNNVGGSFAIKTKKQWYFGFKGNFIWGNNVNETNFVNNLKTEDGYVIDNEGRLTLIFFEERGSSLFLKGGKLFNVLTNNSNSGILVYGGAGVMHNKIRIAFKDEVNSLTEELKKGYDRLSFGYALNGFAGYMHLSKNRFVNFFAGVDLTYGWTKSLRKYNYDTQEVDNRTYSNMLLGLRAGWIIRLNKRTQQEYYYD